ncbi:Hypothetical predicted protein [Mytilus galloprovincialis]|uniref:Novel STAND NTPase 3 domain-containing protein n=1 Tax=Mytilus galloprovincialis TaxID=29158 RepID=A0A8B6CDN4_MYTGA|nr:Hypothetical predicted protein [Mytilus galloprovincialis]
MIRKLQLWEKEDQEYFVETTAYNHVMSCLLNNKCVSVIGPPGVGKTFLVQHVALEMKKIGFHVISVCNPDEIKQNYMCNRKLLFVVDDMCGNFTANTTRLDLWKDGVKDLTYILDKDVCKLILTCRLQVFQDEGFNHSDLHLFKTCVCNLIDDKLALTNSEKEKMAKRYFMQTHTNELKSLYKYEFFPYFCKLYAVNKDRPGFSLDGFLKYPFHIFEYELDELYFDCKEGKYKFSALLLLVVCNNRLNVLESKNDNLKKLLKIILDECGINERLTEKTLISQLDTLTGSYLVNENGVYHTIHEKLFDYLAYYFGTKNEITKTEFTELLIQHADKDFAQQRFQIKQTRLSGPKTVKDYVILLSDDKVLVYIKRLFDDMTHSQEIGSYLSNNRNKNNEKFQKELQTFINKLSHDEITQLIKKASSDFVRGMFVMNKNDIHSVCDKEYCDFECPEHHKYPYVGIILAPDHFPEYIERIFVDMTNSDDVRNYTLQCRNSRNDAFRSALLTLLTNFSSAQLKQQIQKASFSFVQVMFVITVEDINKMSPHVYMRYGIVIPGDVIQVYIERVFDDMTKSGDVEEYIKRIRNRNNKIFQTKLLEHMQQLDRLQIKHLIKNASQDFIDRLCVTTIDDIKDNCDREYERYGVFIPEDCIQLYKTRLIDGLKQSDDTENYLKHNRNRHTEIIKTLLRTHTELPPDPARNRKTDSEMELDLFPFVGTTEDFNKLLSTGTYESFENRVYLCGSCACGKSTLASVLIGSSIPQTWKSTDGLVIYFGRNGINLASFEMVPLKEDDRGHDVLTKVIIGQSNHEKHTTQRAETQQDEHIVAFSVDADHFESHLENIQKDASSGVKPSGLSASKRRSSKELSDVETNISESKTVTHIQLPMVKKVESYVVLDEILEEIKSGQYKIKIAPSDLVDFGGQRSYDMTHQLFVQHGGTFVVMFDGSKEFQEPLKEYPTGDFCNESIVNHWVNSILTYCNDDDDDDVMPMILFAATHSDLLSEDMRKKKKTEFKEKIEKMFGTHKMKKHIKLDSVFFINGTDKDDHEIQSLKNQLVTFAREQPSWGRRRPLIWVPLELMITKMKNDKIHVIPKTYLAEANKMNGDLQLTTKELDNFLLTQHSFGKIMYFNQPELNNFIIIYPPALVNILRSFITDEQFWPTDKTLNNSLQKMTDTGKITKKDLLNLWKQEKFQNDIPNEDDYKEFIIQVLVHLDVLVLPKRCLAWKNDVHVDYFFVPCMVKNKMRMSFLDDESFAKKTITLAYRLKMSFIPPALALKLIGAVSSIWPIMREDGRPLLYDSAAVLCVDDTTMFRIFVEDARVIVYLTHSKSKNFISPDIAASIQECLTLTLKAVLNFYLCSIGTRQQKLDVSKLFLIEVGEICDKSPCVVSFPESKKSSEWMCGHKNQHSSRFSWLWFFQKKQLGCPADCPGLEKDRLVMSPSDKHISRLVAQLGMESCQKLVYQLGLEDKDWKTLEYQYGKKYVEIMALNYWKVTKIPGKLQTKSFNDLLEALKEIGIDRHKLCQVFREDTDLYEIENIDRLLKIPHDDVLKHLLKNLGDCAIQLGIELGIGIYSLEDTMKKYHNDMYHQLEDVLRKWKTSSADNCTIHRLMIALERVHTGGLRYLQKYYDLPI